MMRTILTYEKWLENISLYESEGLKMDCFKCDGDGEVVVECCCCDNESEETCGECEGDGFVEWDGTIKHLRLFHTPDKYKDQVLKDFRRVASFLNKTVEEELFLSGLAPFVPYKPHSKYNNHSAIDFKLH